MSRPVENYCYIHPLGRLINFESGVAVGAIVTDNRLHVSELISRIFRNDMELELIKKQGDYFTLNGKAHRIDNQIAN